MPEKYVRRDGLPLLVRHTGATRLPEAPPFAAASRPEQPVVVCLHDAGLQSSVFEALLERLDALGVNAIAFDMPGHGRSGSLDSLPTVEAMAELSIGLAQACRIERAVLLGHGMGGLVALEWARQSPDSVAGVMLCSAGGSVHIEDAAIDKMRQVTRGKAPRPFDPSRVCKDSGQGAMRAAYMEGVKTDPRATLVDLEASRAWTDAFYDVLRNPTEAPTIGCPVRFVSGAADSEANRERAEELALLLAPSGECTACTVVPGAAHFVPMEKPDALASLVEPFLKNASDSPGPVAS